MQEFNGRHWRTIKGPFQLDARVTVIVPTKDRPKTLHGFLCSMAAQTYKDWELVIIDDSEDPEWHRNQGADPTRLLFEVLAGMGHRVRVVRGGGLGIPAAYDLGLQMCETPLALRQEDDQVLESDYLEILVNEYDRISTKVPQALLGRGVGAIAGLDLNPRGRMFRGPVINPDSLKNYFFWGRGLNNEAGLIPDDDQRSPVVSKFAAYRVFVLHGMWLFNVAALQEAGGFSKILGTLGHREETEASLRLEWEGWSLWLAPKAVAYHLEAGGGSRIQSKARWTHLKHIDETRFQAWLQSQMRRGRAVPVDLQPERLEWIEEQRQLSERS